MIDYNKLKSVDIEKLFIFNELCREGSIKKFLAKHDITPRTIYYTLQVLEAAFDVKLFIKGKRDIILTDEGEKLYNLSMIFLESLKSVKNTKDEDYSGKLTIHSTVGFAHYHLVDAVEKFKILYPSIEIKIMGGPEYLTTKYLDFDIMIGANPINRSELTKKSLRIDEYNFYAAPTYLQSKPLCGKLEDFHGHDILCYVGHHLIDPEIIARNRIVYESNLYSTIVEMCSRGLGIASITRQNIHEHIPKNNLIRLFNGFISEKENVFFSYKTYSILRKPILEFFKILKRYV